MTFPIIPASTVSGSYQISRSLRFRGSASAYLNRTFGTATNPKKWTFSCWVKGNFYNGTNYTHLFGTGAGGTDTTSNQLIWAGTGSNLAFSLWSINVLITNAVYRDPSAWAHVMVVMDNANATASNRAKIYVNGVEASYSTDNRASLSTTTNYAINSAILHTIGRWSYNSFVQPEQFDGYLSEVNFIDGQALTPSSFGAFDTNGVWQPARYTGSYGTNGFYLPFSDNSALTTASNAGIGKDFSGNTNYWVTNNISITAGTTYDSMIDSPTNYADGGNGRGNYAVLSPLDVSASNAQRPTDGNLAYPVSGAFQYSARSTIFVTSGKWYAEFTISSSAAIIAVVNSSAILFGYTATNGIFTSSTSIFNNGTQVQSGLTAFAANDVIGVAFDADANTVQFYRNGSTYGTAVTISAFSGPYTFQTGANGATCTINANFGQRPFTYTPPSGYSALNTQNLTTPTIANGAQYMAAVTYTGDSNSGTVVSPTTTNSGNNPLPTTFQPDFVWIKNRSNTGGAGFGDHMLYDVVRGVLKNLSSNLTDAEGSVSTGLSAFNTTGFTPGTSTRTNQTGNTYVGWQWNAGGSTVSGTGTGGITNVSYRATPTAGFSVVIYTGSGANGTVTHGLGVAPSMIIVKNRSSGTDNWQVYHSSLTSAAYRLRLNTTDAQDSVPTMWNSTAPTSTVFSVGTQTGSNGSTNLMVAYCFAPVAGYSAFGSYTGNGSADGPFVYCGFRPRFLLIKRTDTAADWVIVDTSRNTYNLVTQELYPDLSNAENASTNFDILSNGFKLRGFAGYVGASGGTYIYAAFAENPFKYSRAR